MSNQLEITNGFVRAYQDGVDSVIREHQVAMVVCELDDLVAFGVVLMERLLGGIEKWDAWVSKSMDRYSAADHEMVRKSQLGLLSASHQLLALVSTVTADGHAIEQEDEFRNLVAKLEANVGPLPSTFQREVLKKQFNEADAEYKNGRAEEAANPWS